MMQNEKSNFVNDPLIMWYMNYTIFMFLTSSSGEIFLSNDDEDSLWTEVTRVRLHSSHSTRAKLYLQMRSRSINYLAYASPITQLLLVLPMIWSFYIPGPSVLTCLPVWVPQNLEGWWFGIQLQEPCIEWFLPFGYGAQNQTSRRNCRK